MEFAIFGPKAFAGTQYLPEDLADRAILITTSPAARLVDPLIPDDAEATRLLGRSYRKGFTVPDKV